MRTDDRGETLLELLVAVVIMGIALVAIVGGLVVSSHVSDIHRKQATAGAYVRDYAEAIENAVATGGYVACAPASAYTAPPGFTVPAGFASKIVDNSMRYWDGATWKASCTGDTGLQQLTAQVASTDSRATERLIVVIRKPCRLSDAPCT